MKVKELIEKLKEFDEDFEVFYDDDHYWPVDLTELYTTIIYRNYNNRWWYNYTKRKWDEEIKCVYMD